MREIFIILSLFFAVSAAHALSWNTVTLDSVGDVGWNPHLVFDPHGNPWISYYDATHSDLKIATWHDGNWTTEIVDGEGDVGADSSLAFQEGGDPHIAYHDLTNHNLKYAWKSGGVWRTETIDPTLNGGWDPWLSFTIESEPWIFHLVSADQPLRVVTRVNGTWKRMTERSLSQNMNGPSYVIDEEGYPIIAFYDITNQSLAVIHYNKEGLSIKTVDSSTIFYPGPSVALDLQGNLHISYVGDNSLRHAWQEGKDTWHTEIVARGDRDFPTGTGSSLAFDHAGNPHISYITPIPGILYHAWQAGGVWHHERVDGGGYSSSLAFDADGNPFISYYDKKNGDLKIAYASMDSSDGSGTQEPAPIITSQVSTATPASGCGLSVLLVNLFSLCVVSGITSILLQRKNRS